MVADDKKHQQMEREQVIENEEQTTLVSSQTCLVIGSVHVVEFKLHL
jgi:hypothetical protein